MILIKGFRPFSHTSKLVSVCKISFSCITNAQKNKAKMH